LFDNHYSNSKFELCCGRGDAKSLRRIKDIAGQSKRMSYLDEE
jgi:hypothetical protein